MNLECVYYVVGGDKRSCFQSLALAGRGYKVFHFDPYDADLLRHSSVTIISGSSGIGFKRLIEGECMAPAGTLRTSLVLPVPVTKDGEFITGRTLLTVSAVADTADSFDTVFGGVIPTEIINSCRTPDCAFDYMKDDEVALANAVATAEGAIFDADEMSDVNISGSTCLVTGFGRCAKVLAGKLARWGADVIVMARSRAQRNEAMLNGCKVKSFDDVDIYGCVFEGVDFCFNTVPAPVVGEELLSKLPAHAVVIDIASKPGGVDFDYCSEHGIRWTHSLGIPGRLSPKTSGEILATATVGRIDRAN